MATKSHQSTDGSTDLKIRRGRVGSVDLYEIKDTELDTLERGSPAEFDFNFACILLSFAFAALTTLVTTTSYRAAIFETIFIFVCIVCAVLGIYLLIRWNRERKSLKSLCQRIRDRMPVDSPVAPVDPETDAPILDEPDNAAAPKG